MTFLGSGIMDFSQALELLKQGRRVSRHGWNGKNMWIEFKYPDPDSDMDVPYIYMLTADNKLVPWLCSQTDMYAGDWGEVG